MKIKYLFQLIGYFIITEIVTIIELAVWLQFQDFFISLMNIENDVFGIQHAVSIFLVVIPIISV